MSELPNQPPTPARHCDQITAEIDAALAEQQGTLGTLSVDATMAIEADVWSELEQDVQHGWRTQEEAEAAFVRWRNTYVAAGRSAIQGSQTAGMDSQKLMDAKRRMRR